MLTCRNLILSEAKLISDLILTDFGTNYHLHFGYSNYGPLICNLRERIIDFPLGVIGLIKDCGRKGEVLLGLVYGTRLDEVGCTSSVNHFGNYDSNGRFFYIEGLITEASSNNLRTLLLREMKKRAFLIPGIERVFVGTTEVDDGTLVKSLCGILIQEFEGFSDYRYNIFELRK